MGRRLQIHSKLMQTCIIFSSFSSWLSKEVEKADPDLSGTTKPPTMTDDHWKMFLAARAQRQASQSESSKNDTQDGDARLGTLLELMRKWEYNFSRHLQILLDALNHYAATETVVLLSLCARLSTANQGTEYAELRHEEDVDG